MIFKLFRRKPRVFISFKQGKKGKFWYQAFVEKTKNSLINSPPGFDSLTDAREHAVKFFRDYEEV